MTPRPSRSDRILEIENHELYHYFRERLINLALSQFEWHGLPDSVDRYYMEKQLLLNGKVAFFKPKDVDMWMSMGYIETSGKWDNYGYPKNPTPQDFNARQITADSMHTHIIFDNNNEGRQPLIAGINLHARRLYEVEQTFRSNLRQQNTPYLITTRDAGEAHSVREMFKRVFNYQPVVSLKAKFGATGATSLADQVQTLQTQVPYIGEELLETRQRVWQDALAMLGISSQSTKKERLLDGEIAIQRQESMISLQSRLLNRVEFCNKMNRLYDMDMSVNLSDVSVRDDEVMASGQTVADSTADNQPESETPNVPQ